LSYKISTSALFQTPTRAGQQSVSATTCQDTQEQHIQGPGLLDRDTLVQEPHQDKDILVLLEPLLQVKAIIDQELLLRVKAILVHPISSRAIQELGHLPDPRDTQGLELHLDNKDMEEHLLNRDTVVVEQLLKGMQDSNSSSSSRVMVVQLLPHSRAEAMVEAHL